MTNQRVLISGPRGNIAKAFMAYMRREHPEVGLDTITPFPFLNSALVEKLKSGTFTHFVNCAALGSDSESVANPREYFRVNCEGVTNQLEMIRLYSPKTRYLNFGTIYERSESATPYIASKRAAREVVKAYRETYGIYAVTATLGFTEYYNRADHYLSRRITKGVAKIAQAIKGGDFEPLVLRDIDQTYCWTWAEDVADGIWRMLNQEIHRSHCNGDGHFGRYFDNRLDAIANDTYDEKWYDGWLRKGLRDYVVSSNDPHTVREFVEAAFAAADLSGEWISGGDLDRFDLESASTVAETQDHIDIELLTYEGVVIASKGAGKLPINYDARIEFDLGWKPRFSFQDIVREMTLHDLKQVGL